MAAVVDGVERRVAAPVPFTARVLDNTTLPAADRSALVAFQQRLAEIQRVTLGVQRYAGEVNERLQVVEKALQVTPDAGEALLKTWTGLRARMLDIDRRLNGDNTISSRNGNTGKAIVNRIQYLMYFIYRSTSAPAQQHREQAEDIVSLLTTITGDLRALGETDLPRLENELEQLRAPWTPGRLPELR
jgi:hypothetical protein